MARSYRRHRLRTRLSVSHAEGRAGMDITLSMSGLPLRMSSVSRNTSMTSLARGNPRRMVRMSGVVSSTSPRRRSVITRMRGRSGRSRLVIVTSATRKDPLRVLLAVLHWNDLWDFSSKRRDSVDGDVVHRGGDRATYLAAGYFGSAHVFSPAFTAASAARNTIPPVRPTPKT